MYAYVSDFEHASHAVIISKGPPSLKEIYKAFRKEFRHRFPDYKFGSPHEKKLPTGVAKEKPWRPKTEKDLQYPPYKFKNPKYKQDE